MTRLQYRSMPRGQAMVEAVLAIALLALFMHGMATVGALQFNGLAAAQLSRHAAFAAARGQTDLPHARTATVSEGPVQWLDASAQAGDPQAVALARDWLRADPRLRTAQATVHPPSAAAFARRDSPASVLAIRRHTTLAANAGHASSDTAAAQRIEASAAGWADAARRSRDAAQALRRRMQPVDAPWGRGDWSVDWLGPWADLAPLPAATPGR